MNTTAPRSRTFTAGAALALAGAVLASCAKQAPLEEPAASTSGSANALQQKRPDMAEAFAGMDLAQELPEPLSAHPALTVETVAAAAEGEAEAIRYGQIGRFHLVGTLANGSTFQNTYGGDAPEPALMRVLDGSMPKGLALGLDGCKVGERRLISMPSELAYGDTPDFSQGAYIPAHAALTYEIELVEVVDDLQIKILQEGSGEPFRVGQQGQFQYIGVLADDGTVFDQSAPEKPFVSPLTPGSVIVGWTLGLAGMKVDEKRRLRIPSDLAYGERGGGAGSVIGPGDDLVFDVELTGILEVPGQR